MNTSIRNRRLFFISKRSYFNHPHPHPHPNPNPNPSHSYLSSVFSQVFPHHQQHQHTLIKNHRNYTNVKASTFENTKYVCWKCGRLADLASPTCTQSTPSKSSSSQSHSHSKSLPGLKSREESLGGKIAGPCGAVQPVHEWLTFFDVFDLSPPELPLTRTDATTSSPSSHNNETSPGRVLVLLREGQGSERGRKGIATWGFDLDVVALKRRFLNLQSQVHPDAHSLKSQEERSYSELQSSFINKAYEALKEPLSRAKYILHLNGIHIGDVAEVVDKDILMKAMEVWESLEEAENESDFVKLQKENDARVSETIAKLSQAFKNGDLQQAKKFTMELNYWRNLERTIRDAL